MTNSLSAFEANSIFAFSDNSVFLEGEEEVWLLIGSRTSSVCISVYPIDSLLLFGDFASKWLLAV